MDREHRSMGSSQRLHSNIKNRNDSGAVRKCSSSPPDSKQKYNLLSSIFMRSNTENEFILVDRRFIVFHRITQYLFFIHRSCSHTDLLAHWPMPMNHFDIYLTVFPLRSSLNVIFLSYFYFIFHYMLYKTNALQSTIN